MTKQKFDRRDILRGAVVGGAAAASATGAIAQPQNALAQQPLAAPVASDAAGYAFFNLEEAAFIEALVDHMPCPKIISSTSRDCAPSATRTPISRVRRLTE